MDGWVGVMPVLKIDTWWKKHISQQLVHLPPFEKFLEREKKIVYSTERLVVRAVNVSGDSV